MQVYLLKETNELSSGEKDVYVDVYETEEKAINAMEKDINEHIENNGAKISSGNIGDWYVELTDDEENEYYFKIELTTVK